MLKRRNCNRSFRANPRRDTTRLLRQVRPRPRFAATTRLREPAGQTAPPSWGGTCSQPGRLSALRDRRETRSEEHTYELQSLMRISYAGFCLKKKNKKQNNKTRAQ